MINKNILEETVFKIPLKCFKKHKMFSLIHVFYLLHSQSTAHVLFL